ncbi:MAG: hypothetical protein HYR72_02565 [Deltaproteobacteria bacterium]|nr:hypothetical protein [Deltaproteobacteria bacterium]MBI3388297.1 hypothetical protein [Deltaproteobacteria bacterium]
METSAPKPAPKKGVDINVLKCLNPDCGGLLAYEVDSNNVLHVDLAWTAKADGAVRYFPCPKCDGRNVVEPFTDAKGKAGHRVTHFAPSP